MRSYLTLVVVAAVVVGAASLAYGYAWSVRQAIGQATDRMDSRAERAAQTIAAELEEAAAQASAVSAQPVRELAFAPPGCTLTGGGGEAFTDVRVDLVDPTGSVGCSSQPEVAALPSPHARATWLTEGLASAGVTTHWGQVDPVTGTPSVVVTSPFRGADGPVAGVVAVFLHHGATASDLAHDLGEAEAAAFTIVDGDGVVVSTSTSTPTAVPTGRSAPYPAGRSRGVWADLDGTSRIFASHPAPGTEWTVFAGIAERPVVASAWGLLVRQALVGLVALLVLVAGAWILNRQIARPLRALTEGVVRAGAGHHVEPVPERGSSEMVTLARAFNTMVDIHEGHQARLAHLATHDGVTGLPNASSLRAALERALDAEGGVNVLCVGLDRFQLVIDSIGHDGADQVLAAVSERLSAAVGPGDTVARAGGSRFVVLAVALTPAEAIELARRLHATLAEPVTGTTAGADVLLHPAVGLARPDGRKSPEQLLREADTAMSHARSTRMAWTQFESEMQTEATSFLQTGEALRHALTRDELVVHYQPLVDLRDGAVFGAEALVRWQHPGRGLLGPAEFIPVAEATGQIAAVGRVVLGQACAQAAAWAAQGRPLRVSVNVASEQLRDDSFVSEVAGTLASTGLQADRLCLELTESSLVGKASGAVDTLRELRALGAHLSIDDFGTGYSSLSYLHDLPFDEVKIDRSFVGRIHHARNRHLVGAILGMADALNLSVVAEGVETRTQLDALVAMGCEHAQGYWFAKPLSPHAFVALPARFEVRNLVPAQR